MLQEHEANNFFTHLDVPSFDSRHSIVCECAPSFGMASEYKSIEWKTKNLHRETQRSSEKLRVTVKTIPLPGGSHLNGSYREGVGFDCLNIFRS
jgi:hypothetical protein